MYFEQILVVIGLKIRHAKDKDGGRSMFKKLKGFTNIEMIVVVGIVSVLSTVVYFIYESANDKRIVSAEISKVSTLIKNVTDAKRASDYSDLTNVQLSKMGIYYQSEFENFKIDGISPQSFKITYDLMNEKSCTDLVLKTAIMNDEYNISRSVNGINITLDPLSVNAICNKNQNKVELVFKNLPVQSVVSINPGVPKPPPVYVAEASWELDYPDRGDVPTNLNASGVNVNSPIKPMPGAYIPPNYVIATNPSNPIISGGSNPGSGNRPSYVPNNPLGPLNNPPDLGNEWVPEIPPVPPRPPATAPNYSGKYTCYNGSVNAQQCNVLKFGFFMPDKPDTLVYWLVGFGALAKPVYFINEGNGYYLSTEPWPGCSGKTIRVKVESNGISNTGCSGVFSPWVN